MEVDDPELKDENSYIQSTFLKLWSGKDRRIGIDRRNEVEHIGINRSTDERRRRFSVFKVWSDYFTIDIKKAGPKKALPFYMCKPYYADVW